MRRLWVAIFALLATPAVARAGVLKYAVLVGNNEGRPNTVELLYAKDDARRLGEILERLGGVRPENLTFLLDRTPADLRATLIALNERIRRDVQDGRHDVLLFVYYSGHADADRLHLGGEAFSLDELRQLVRGSPATFRVMLLDACRSGSLTRVKGGRPGAPFDIGIEDALATEGSVFITSSAADEDSQESDTLGGSFFSHYFMSGLLGAADASSDGKVSLAEAYGYAREQTVKATSRTLAGTQHPTFQHDMKGKGDVILTDLALDSPDKAALLFPEAGHYLVLEDGPSGVILAELQTDRAMGQLVVAPGTYFVRRRGDDDLREGAVRVEPREQVIVDTGGFERIRYARLVRKGAGVREATHGPQVLYRYRGEVLDNLGATQMWGIAYATTMPWITLTPRLAYGTTSSRNDLLSSTTRHLELAVAATHAIDWWRLSAAVGLEAGGALVSQSFETSGRAPPRRTLGALFGGIATLGLELAAGFYVEGQAELVTYVLRQGRSADAGKIATPLTVAFGFALGKNF